MGDDHYGNGHTPGPLPESFPCKVYIKAVGRESVRFEAVVQGIVSRHIDPTDLLATSRRLSREGNYLAITLTVNARSRAQLDDIYQDLSHCEDVLIAL